MINVYVFCGHVHWKLGGITQRDMEVWASMDSIDA